MGTSAAAPEFSAPDWLFSQPSLSFKHFGFQALLLLGIRSRCGSLLNSETSARSCSVCSVMLLGDGVYLPISHNGEVGEFWIFSTRLMPRHNNQTESFGPQTILLRGDLPTEIGPSVCCAMSNNVRDMPVT